jgi:hypothetical protein
MGFLPGIFGGAKQQPAPQQAQQNPGQQFGQSAPNPQGQQQQPGPQVNPNGSGGPAGGQMSNPANGNFGDGNQAPNPMDQWMGKLTPSKEVLTAQQQAQQNQNQNIFGALTPEQIQQHVSKTNFTQSIDPAKMQAAMGGDVNAFQEVLNSALQAGMAAQIQMTQGMVEHGVKTGNDRLSGTLDSRFKDFSVRSQTAKNPALEHPLAQQFLSGIKKQLMQAQPNMSPQQVQEQAEQMLGDFATHVQQPAKQAEQAKQPQGMNWETFLEE